MEYHINSLPEDKFDPKVVRFFIPVIPTPENISKFKEIFPQLFVKLSDLTQLYVTTSVHAQIIPKPIITKKSTRYDKPIQNFMIKKINKLQLQINKFKSEFYEQKARIINDVTVYINSCFDSECFMEFDIEGYKARVMREYDNHPTVKKIIHHSNSILNYLARLDQSIEERLNINLMKQTLAEATKFVDTDLDFSPYNSFDAAFADFTEASKTIQRFDICVANVIKTLTKRRINMKELDQVNKSFNLLFEPKNANERLVMHSAIVRVMFDEISLVKNFFLFSEEGSEMFVEKCAVIRRQTPKKLQIVENIMLPVYMNQPFEEIVSISPDLIDATRILNSLHFLTNPYDIVYQTFKAVRSIDQFVKNNLGGKGNTNMSFDDVFSLFCPVMAMDPPKNAVALSRFLLSVDGLKFSQPLDFSKLMLSSSIDYISNKTI